MGEGEQFEGGEEDAEGVGEEEGAATWRGRGRWWWWCVFLVLLLLMLLMLRRG